MYLFIDESGDPGCNNSATRFFIIAIVIFDKVEDMIAIQQKIEEFKKTEQISGELHFCKTPNNTRDKFFNFIKNYEFTAKVICIDKTKLYSPFLKEKSYALYNYMLKQLIEKSNINGKIKITIDGKGNKTVLQLKQLTISFNHH